MIPWEHLDTGPIPGGGELRLMRRGDEYAIRLGAHELMNSRLGHSEEVLAERACAALAGRSRPQVLIGGLGLGFTLRAALAALGPDALLVVAELVPAVIAWARGPLAGIFAGCLDDPRVTIREADVGDLIGRERGRYDAILLDVDNGPEGLTRASNDRLYGASGLGSARAALRPGGVLAVWSTGPSRPFTAALRRAGFAVEEAMARERKGRGARHAIWIATVR